MKKVSRAPVGRRQIEWRKILLFMGICGLIAVLVPFLSGENVLVKVPGPVRIVSEEFVLYLQEGRHGAIFDKFARDRNVNKSEFLGTLDTIMDNYGQVISYRLKEQTQMSSGRFIAKYRLVFDKAGEIGVLFQFECQNNDSCRLLGVAFNPTGWTGERFYLRLKRINRDEGRVHLRLRRRIRKMVNIEEINDDYRVGL